MATDRNESASVRQFNSEEGPPEAKGAGDEFTEIEEELHQVFSSLLALAQEQHLSTISQLLSRLKRDTEECLVSGCSPIFCPAFPTNARQALSEFGFLMDLRECTTRLSTQELRAKFAELEKYLAYAEWDFKDSQVGFKNEAARLAGVYGMRVSQFISETSEELTDEIREQFRLLEQSDRSQRSERMSSCVGTRLQELLGNWQSPFEESSMELFQHTATRFARHAREVITGIRSSTLSLFGCSVQNAEWSVEYGESDCWACTRDQGPDCFLSSTRLHLPTVHFRKHLLRNTLRSASSDLLGYASHAVEEHKIYLDKCCGNLVKHMTEQLGETKAGICDVVEMSLCKSERQDLSASAKRVHGENRDFLDSLHRYAERLDLLLCRWESAGDTTRESRTDVKGTTTGDTSRSRLARR